MNRRELQDILRAEHIRDDAYSLYGGHPNEKYTLSEIEGKWFVYYSERGMESGKKSFTSESEACSELLRLLIKDPTTRK